jgi:hypothetical protein
MAFLGTKDDRKVRQARLGVRVHHQDQAAPLHQRGRQVGSQGRLAGPPFVARDAKGFGHRDDSL